MGHWNEFKGTKEFHFQRMNEFKTIPVVLLACWKTLDRNDPFNSSIN